MKKNLTLLVVLLNAQLIFSQEKKPQTDNYTIQRLVVHNNKNEILMQKNKFGWFTPAIRSNKNQSLREGLDSLATAIGIKIGKIKLSGIFTYKYNGLSDHIGIVSYRTHYLTQYKSGSIIQPNDTTRVYKWMPIKDAIEIINMPALKSETQQIIKYPKTVWGGSFLLQYENEIFKSSDMIEKFYDLTSN